MEPRAPLSVSSYYPLATPEKERSPLQLYPVLPFFFCPILIQLWGSRPVMGLKPRSCTPFEPMASFRDAPRSSNPFPVFPPSTILKPCASLPPRSFFTWPFLSPSIPGSPRDAEDPRYEVSQFPDLVVVAVRHTLYAHDPPYALLKSCGFWFHGPSHTPALFSISAFRKRPPA